MAKEQISLKSIELVMGLGAKLKRKSTTASRLSFSISIPFKIKKEYLEKHTSYGSFYLPKGEDIKLSKKVNSLFLELAEVIAEEMIDNNIKNNK